MSQPPNTSLPSTDPQFWAQRWENQNTPWDLGRPHPQLERLLEWAAPHLPEWARFYIPACGRAHESATLVSHGYGVVGEDIVPDAIAAARALYGQLPGVEFRVGDLFEVRDRDRGRFNAVFDRAALCALPPERWSAFFSACADRLKPGGLMLSLPFLETRDPERPRPPYFTEADHWKDLASVRFEVVQFERNPIADPESVILAEGVALLRRRTP